MSKKDQSGGEKVDEVLDAQDREFQRNLENSGLTKEQIAGWKKQYEGLRKIYVIQVPVDDQYEDFLIGVVKDPPDQILNEFLRKQDRAMIDASRALLNSIWLGGDERIKTVREYLISYMGELSEKLMGGQASSIKNF